MTPYLVTQLVIWGAVAYATLARVLKGDRDAQWTLAVAAILTGWTVGLLMFGGPTL
jgi:hypothetical protein